MPAVETRYRSAAAVETRYRSVTVAESGLEQAVGLGQAGTAQYTGSGRATRLR